MCVELPRDHHCPWREHAERLVAELEARVAGKDAELADKIRRLELEVARLERQLFGKKSEKIKIPPAERELDAREELTDEERAREAEETAKKRRERATARSASMPTVEEVLRVPEADKRCPTCGGESFSHLDYEESTTYDYVPGHFVRRVYKREKVACRCGECILTAPPPPKIIERGRYGPGFAAFIIVDKCADSIPIYRIEKRLHRLGIPISRSTMNDVLHDTAELLAPLVARIEARVRTAEIVLADETSMRMMDGKTKGFVWVFQGRDAKTDAVLVLYVFATSRSGDTPARILGGTEGTLVVDGYTGYNVVTDPDGRQRGGCWCHARRKLYEAFLAGDTHAVEGIDLVRGLFRVEHEALVRGIVRTDDHLALRLDKSQPITDKIIAWVRNLRGGTPPKTPLGAALGYLERQWDRLTLFLTDARIPLHNNDSERALRVVTLGKKNYLFVGHPRAGRNLAGLYSLVGTCVANGVEPTAYFTDVIPRVGEATTDQELDALLPDQWAPRD